VRAVRETARRLGLRAGGVRVIRDSNNTVVLLPAERLVAKVSTSTLAARGPGALERELELGRRLAAHGVAAAAPAAGRIAGPHRAEGVVLTLWEQVQAGAKPADGDRLLGVVVRDLHAALAGVAGELPTLAETVERAHRLFQDPDSTPGLTAADRSLTARAHERLVTLLGRLDQSAGLHGEPHGGNVLWTAGGPVLIDFEAACAGPREWDLAYLPAAALGAFPDRDEDAIAGLRPGVSFCVAAWCSSSRSRAPEVAHAAAHHMDALRRSLLVS
jgi:Ser/Thr protein kinase RdoA (MazF antagonist)